MSVMINRQALSKGWQCYYIMHKDRRVATIREDGTCTVYYPSFMPYNLYFEIDTDNDIDVRVNNLNNFYYWCASRVLTLDRKYAKEILNSIGANQATTDKERAMIAISYHGLSLNDVYWIKSRNENVSFSQISLYRHSLSNAFVDVSLRGKQLTAQNAELISQEDAAGNIGTLGVAPKAWIRENGSFWLLKDGDIRDVDAELLASKIARCFNLNQVVYEASEYDGEKVSKSKLITSEETSIVSIEYIDIYCQNTNKNRTEFVLKKDSYSYYMMNIIDYLVGNTDRHWGNWGFCVDNNNNKLQGLYSLMDFNKSFLSYDDIDGARCQTTDKNISQREAAIEAVKKIGLNQIAEVSGEWFEDDKIRDMFFSRLDLLQIAEKGI